MLFKFTLLEMTNYLQQYENDSHQNGSKSTEFPGQRREQASPSRASRSSFSSNPDGKVQDPSAARSQVTEEGGSGGPLGAGSVSGRPAPPHAAQRSRYQRHSRCGFLGAPRREPRKRSGAPCWGVRSGFPCDRRELEWRTGSGEGWGE
ncbi:hypothetical protein QTO34_005774 [Cnephaeus nilssonii]|uniref:Uncharacterized protein n=1 Tax=Cnephaeus nilssonii TaxID=3371016 RepID=A0AA40LH52_CNENI|nr:hypothetical protein QTO34_005774 [Eptesicus nilssonii]